MITTTLNRIREHGPCAEGWEKLLHGLGKTKADDEPLPFSRIVEINGLDDALWCCRVEPQHAREWRLFAVWCARQVQSMMTDPRSVAALDVAERHANGLASDEELVAARDAAWAAAWEDASDEELAAASGAAIAAEWAAAWEVAWEAAWEAASAAAWEVAWEAAWEDASDAAWDAAWEVASAAACDAQRVRFLEVVGGVK